MLLQTRRHGLAVLLCCASLLAWPAVAQSTIGWLRYAIPPDPPRYHALPHAVVLLGNNAGQAAPEELAAADELDRGLGHMVAGTDVVLHHFDPRIDAIVLGTTEALHRARIGRSLPGWTEKPLQEEGFRIVHLRRGVREWYILQGGSPRAELWAAFRFAALVAEDQQLPEDLTDTPYLPLRGVDLGRAERVLPLLEGSAAIIDAATPLDASRDVGKINWPRFGLLRLLASIGVNALFIEGSAADAERAAALVRPYGMRVWLRPAETAGAGPEDLSRMPAATSGFGGLMVRVPPHASLQELRAVLQLANTEARMLRRSGASVILEDALGAPLRDVTGAKNEGAHELSPEERAPALRGLLEPNIILLGAAVPAALPLSGIGSANFGLLPGAQQIAVMEVLSQPYDRLAYPITSWAAALRTPERGLHGETTLAGLLRGTGEANLHSGVVGTLPAEGAERMLRQPLLQANLYAFGRLAWSPMLAAQAVTEEWARQAWGDDARVHAVATGILLGSSESAVNNAAPLGLAGTPRADGNGIGTDRTRQGTNEIARYPSAFADELADPLRCPEPWLLLFHRMPYRAGLPNGKSLAQSFYDAHFKGAAQAANALDAWESTHGLIDEGRYSSVHTFLAVAATHAGIDREIATEWMQRASGIPDALGFVGSHPGRLEAEGLESQGFSKTLTEPGQASGGARVICSGGDCTAATRFQGNEDVYRVEVGYLDEHRGGRFELLVNGEVRARWQDSTTGTAAEVERFAVNGVRLKTGDRVAVHAAVSGEARAPLDFIEITRDPRWN